MKGSYSLSTSPIGWILGLGVKLGDKIPTGRKNLLGTAQKLSFEAKSLLRISQNGVKIQNTNTNTHWNTQIQNTNTHWNTQIQMLIPNVYLYFYLHLFFSPLPAGGRPSFFWNFAKTLHWFKTSVLDVFNFLIAHHPVQLMVEAGRRRHITII